MDLYNEEVLVQYINDLIEKDEIWKFYKTKEFQELREKVLQEAHYECRICRSKGKITKANAVHHIYYVRDYPQYALTRYVIDDDNNRVINLIPLCNTCHNNVHYEDKIGKVNKKDFVNEERWD